MLDKMTIEVQNATAAKIQAEPGLLTGLTIEIAGGSSGGGSITDAIGKKHGIENLGEIVKNTSMGGGGNYQNMLDTDDRNQLLSAVKGVYDGVPGAQEKYDLTSRFIAASIIKRIQKAILNKPELIDLFN